MSGEPSVVDKALLQELLHSLDNLLIGQQPAVPSPGMSAGPEPLPADRALVVPAAGRNL